MAGLTFTVGGVDITNYIDVRTLVIDVLATSGMVGTCSFKVWDDDGAVTIDPKDTVDIDDDGTTLFGGEVVDVSDANNKVAQVWNVTCQDYNIYLDETVVASESYAAGTTDAAIIDDLFTTYRADIDSTTYVSTLDASMEAVAFAGMTLAEILADLASRTGGRWYVDFDLNLHWFSTEINAAAFSLSTEPDFAASFSYGDFQRSRSAGRLANKVYVLGKEVSGWVEDAASIVTYGERHAVSRDQRITTAQGITDRGNAILDRYDLPRSSYECWTYKQGLVAGMSITLVNSVWSINDTFYIRRLRTSFLGADGDTERRHYLWLDDEPPDAVTSARHSQLRATTIETTINEIGDGVFDTDAPATPAFVGGNLSTGVDIDADGHQIVYIQMTWGSVADADLSYYQAQMSTSADLSGYTITRNHGADGDRIERFVGILGSTTYYFRVRAVDWVGNTSAWSGIQNIASSADSSAPAQVAGLTGAGARTLIGLSWTANTEADLSQYEVQRAPDSGGASGVYATITKTKSTFYIDEDHTEAAIAASTTYWYRVRAVDTSGNEGAYSAETSASLSQIGEDTIAAGAIITAKLAAGAVTADKITVANLEAISASMGSLTSGTVTGATIRTAAAGARVQMDSVDGIIGVNAAAGVTFKIGVDGAGFLGNGDITWNTAGGLTVQGGILVDGTVVATAFSNTIGDPLFTAAGGLLLFGPHTALTTTAWTGSRGQTATLSGAFHVDQGAWLGTRGLVIEEATTNYITNPSGEVNTTGWSEVSFGTITAVTTDSVFGDGCFSVTLDGDTAGSSVYINTAVGSFVQGDDVAVSIWLKGTKGESVILRAHERTAADAFIANLFSGSVTMTGDWQRVERLNTCAEATCSLLRLLILEDNADVTVLVDGVQIEKDDHATSYCDGSLGTGYLWTGSDHLSTSTRAATECNLDAYASLLDTNDTFSVRCVFQAPYDYDETWSVAFPVIWDVYEDANNGVRVRYHESNQYFQGVVVSGGTTITLDADSFTFVAGEWIDAVLTVDFSSNSYVFYVQGEAVDSDTTALANISPVACNIGTNQAGASPSNAVIAEFSVFDTVLAAAEVAGLYVFNKPLVDAGALDLPGIYLYDGRFRLASSDSGARTEIDVDGIKAYTSAAQSIAIQTDGDAFFGSDISAAATTAIAILANAQTYNSEALGAGDVLLGDNTASKANILWDKSAGTLKFRGGTTTQTYINTDGSLTAGGGAIKLSSAANLLFSVSAANQGLAWFSDAGFSDGAGYLRVETAGNNDMRLVTGDTGVAGYSDFYLQTESSDGTRTPMAIDASAKTIEVYSGFTDAPDSAATLGLRNNNDGDWVTLYVQQENGTNRAVAHFDQDDTDSSPPVIRLDGPTGSPGSIAGYIKVNVNNTDCYFAYYT